MSEMKTLKFPGDSEPREIVDATARKQLEEKLDKVGWTPDKYLGTDSDGRVVEKAGPETPGGTSDYSVLSNKPQINGVELSGNKTAGELGIGQPTDEQVSSAVQTYLDEHPEAATTVADGSVDTNKLADLAVTPDKTSFMRITPDEYLWTISDFNLRETARTGSDPEASDCIYAGWYSDFKEYSGSELWAVYNYENVTEYPNYLSTLVLFYDAEKSYLGKGHSFQKSAAYITGSKTKIYLCLPPEGTAYVRFYTTEAQQTLDFITNGRFYSSLVKENVVKLDDGVVTAFIDGYNILPMGATNLMKGNEFVQMPVWGDLSPQVGFYVGTPQNKLATMFPMEVTGETVYSLIKTNTETDAWRILMRHSISCFDENKTHIGNVGYAAKDENGNNGVGLSVLYQDKTHSYVKYTLPAGTRYITAFGDQIYVTADMTEHVIISECEIPLDADPDEYRAVKSSVVDTYVYDKAQKVIDDNAYHQFRKIGKLVPQSADANYQCWGHNMLHYDSTKDVFACAIRGSVSHGGDTSPTGFSLIDPKTLKASEQVNVTVDDLTTDPIWCCGFWINAEGQYIMLGYVGDVVYRLVSTDYGTTWTNSGEITVTEGESQKFFSVYRLSSGRLLGAYDDTVVSTSESTLTKIGLSDDDGVTWSVLTLECEYGTVEQSFVEIGNVVMMLARKNAYGSTRNPVYISYSTDDGATWSKIVASKTLHAHSSDSCAYVHDGIVEVFCITRYFNNTEWGIAGKIGQLTHFSATEEQALNDVFFVREIFYGDGNVSGDFTSPACAVDSEGNVLVSYADSQKGSSDPTEWHFLYSGNKPVVCDARASAFLPYSGEKIDEIIAALRVELGLSS